MNEEALVEKQQSFSYINTRRTLSLYLPLREKGGSTPQVTVLNPTVTFNASVSMSTVVRSVLVSLTALTSPLRTSACSHVQEGIQGIQRKKCEYIDIDRHIFMHISPWYIIVHIIVQSSSVSNVLTSVTCY